MKYELSKCNVDLLKDKMLKRGLTVEDLADKLNLHRSSLYRQFQNGFANTKVIEVRKIVSILELPHGEAEEIFGIRLQASCEKNVTKESYPKRYMGISELSEYTGLSRDYFKSISKAKDAPIIRTTGGGKIYFKTDELDAYMQKVTEARRARSRW